MEDVGWKIEIFLTRIILSSILKHETPQIIINSILHSNAYPYFFTFTKIETELKNCRPF